MNGETTDSFITALYGLAEHCQYKALHDEMIRDHIIVGIRDVRKATDGLNVELGRGLYTNILWFLKFLEKYMPEQLVHTRLLLPSSASLVHTLTSKCSKLLGLYKQITCVMFTYVIIINVLLVLFYSSLFTWSASTSRR